MMIVAIQGGAQYGLYLTVHTCTRRAKYHHTRGRKGGGYKPLHKVPPKKIDLAVPYINPLTAVRPVLYPLTCVEGG